MGLRLSSIPFNTLIEYSPLNGRLFKPSIKDYLTPLVSARPISCDSEVSPGGGVCQLPVPWLLVPGPVAGVERLRADRYRLWLEALTNWIGTQTRSPAAEG